MWRKIQGYVTNLAGKLKKKKNKKIESKSSLQDATKAIDLS